MPVQWVTGELEEGRQAIEDLIEIETVFCDDTCTVSDAFEFGI
jgi:hypothetical protein